MIADSRQNASRIACEPLTPNPVRAVIDPVDAARRDGDAPRRRPADRASRLLARRLRQRGDR